MADVKVTVRGATVSFDPKIKETKVADKKVVSASKSKNKVKTDKIR